MVAVRSDYMITQEQVKSVLKYTNGRLYWIKRGPGKKLAGDAGCELRTGYRIIRVIGRAYLTHRLVFLYHQGYLPKYVDHIDGNPLNNRIENLRECTQQQNTWNSLKPSTNTSGVKGVSWDKLNLKWVVRMRANKKTYNFGRFKSLGEARVVAIQKRNELHGKFANHG